MMKTKANIDFGKMYIDWLKQNIDQYKINEKTFRVTLPFLYRQRACSELLFLN